MEENIAILIADLSGYTALTETHGAVSAADLVDKFILIVENNLVGDCELKERTGDEVMIVSASPDDLLSTSVMIMNAALKEDNFLQIHGGIHYGKVLKRKNGYFGSTVNLTARIAAKASPGSFWCSNDFIHALTDKSTFPFQTKGEHSFKNVSGRKELSELRNTSAHSFVIDPVCRMLILDKSKAIRHLEEAHHLFCSQACHDIFSKQSGDRSRS